MEFLIILGIVFLVILFVKGFSTDPSVKDVVDEPEESNENEVSHSEPEIEDRPPCYPIYFMLKGLRYRGNRAHRWAQLLKPGDELWFSHDFNNAHDMYAMKVETENDIFMGYVSKEYSETIHNHFTDVYKVIVWDKNDDVLPRIELKVYFKGQEEYYEEDMKIINEENEAQIRIIDKNNMN